MIERTSDYKIHETTFRVCYGDMAQIRAEALVSSDDSHLRMNGGVSRALLNAGGEFIQQDARKHKSLKVGDVVVTSAGQLPAKYIFHAITIDWDQQIYAGQVDISAATLKCMQLTEALKVKHIAFPALGTGSAGFSFQLAAETMTRTIADYLGGETGLELVTLTLFGGEGVAESDLNLFYEQAAALASISTSGKQLNRLLGELEKIVGQMQRPELSSRVIDLQGQLDRARTVLAENSASLEQIEQIESRSGIATVSRQIVELSTHTQNDIAWDNRQLEAEVVRTRLSGLLTQLNILYSNLNKLQIKKAKYGLDVPLHLENSIEDLQQEIGDIELQAAEARTQLAGLSGAPG